MKEEKRMDLFVCVWCVKEREKERKREREKGSVCLVF